MTRTRMIALLAVVTLTACAGPTDPTAAEPGRAPAQNGLVLGSGNNADTTSTPDDAGGGLVLGSGN